MGIEHNNKNDIAINLINANIIVIHDLNLIIHDLNLLLEY
jgi:hypothetical protein